MEKRKRGGGGKGGEGGRGGGERKCKNQRFFLLLLRNRANRPKKSGIDRRTEERGNNWADGLRVKAGEGLDSWRESYCMV